ncbi:MAG: ABC transporter ATP-binding protein [Actinomycetes bacterium]
MIKVEGLTVKISHRNILNDISLEIPHGHWTCLVGPNGAGKTTFLKVLLGVRAYSGSLQDNGVEVYRNHKRNVAFVPQHPHIPTGMTVSEYVALGRSKVEGWGNESPKSRAFIQEVLIQTQLYGMHERHVAQLSGGEMQRALIARALAQEPELILLDEPTSALDLHHQISVLNNIEILKTRGVTVISTMHDITLAAMYAERIVVMHEGRTLLDGSAADVIHSAELRTAFDNRINVYTLDSGRPVIVASKDDSTNTKNYKL